MAAAGGAAEGTQQATECRNELTHAAGDVRGTSLPNAADGTSKPRKWLVKVKQKCFSDTIVQYWA